MQTKTLSERIAEIQRASQLETFGFKTDPRNETAEKIILEFLKSQKWVAQKSIEIIEELQAENQALLAKNRELEENGWLPIETAPKEGSQILIFEKRVYKLDEEEMFIARWIEDGWYIGDNDDVDCWAENPTHWMPLPELPTKIKGE